MSGNNLYNDTNNKEMIWDCPIMKNIQKLNGFDFFVKTI